MATSYFIDTMPKEHHGSRKKSGGRKDEDHQPSTSLQANIGTSGSLYDMATKKKVCKLPLGIPLDTGKSLRQVKRERRAERASTKGKNWYNMKTPELTQEQKIDLEVLKMRKAFDPKRFYKGNDYRGLPKYVEFGTVIDSQADFYSRIPKKQRKKSIIAEMIADSGLKNYNKRKLDEIQEAKVKETGAYRKVKRLKKKKK